MECKKIEIFTHVSTCFVNSDRTSGVVHETIYEDDRDPDEIVDAIMKLSFDEVKQR